MRADSVAITKLVPAEVLAVSVIIRVEMEETRVQVLPGLLVGVAVEVAHPLY
jgi:hypothetical protein